MPVREFCNMCGRYHEVPRCEVAIAWQIRAENALTEGGE